MDIIGEHRRDFNPPPPAQPSYLLPLFETGVSATCSLMIHLLCKCKNVIISQHWFLMGIDQYPEMLRSQTLQEKSTILPEAEVSSKWTIIEYNIFSCAPEKTGKHPGTSGLDPSRAPQISACWSLYWVELVPQGMVLPGLKALWEAGMEELFLCGKSHVGSSTIRF